MLFTLHFDLHTDSFHSQQIHLPNDANLPCTALEFYNDQTKDHLACATAAGPILLLSISKTHQRATLHHTFSEHLPAPPESPRFARSLSVSADGTHLAASLDGPHSIHLFSLRPLAHRRALPPSSAPATVLRFHPASNLLLVALADRTFLAWDADRGVARPPRPLPAPANVDREDGVPTNLALRPAGAFVVGFHRGLSAVDGEESSTCARYDGILFAEFLEEDELVVVEQPWLSVLENLPDAMDVRRYGT